MVKLGVLVSGGGTNLQAIIDAITNNEITGAEIAVVISNKENAYALERAAKYGIDTVALPKKEYPTKEAYDLALIEALRSRGVDYVIMAGFLVVVGSTFVEAFKNRVINVHPSLIPSFCGDGFYGLKVHQAALDYGVKITGATVHFVDVETDSGPIILQKAVAIEDHDTAETLQKKVMEQAEWVILPQAIQLLVDNKIEICGRNVLVKGDK